jgi:tRNA(Ile2) C34 agmatinyltransferase TiaS
LVEDHVEISKVEPRCTFCGSDQDLLEMHGRYACKRCSRDLSAATKVAKPRATKPDRRVVATR